MLSNIYHLFMIFAVFDPWLLINTIDKIAVFTARRLAKRGICRRRVSVCVCVCPSHSGIVSKRLNIGSRKQRRMIAP